MSQATARINVDIFDLIQAKDLNLYKFFNIMVKFANKEMDYHNYPRHIIFKINDHKITGYITNGQFLLKLETDIKIEGKHLFEVKHAVFKDTWTDSLYIAKKGYFDRFQVADIKDMNQYRAKNEDLLVKYQSKFKERDNWAPYDHTKFYFIEDERECRPGKGIHLKKITKTILSRGYDIEMSYPDIKAKFEDFGPFYFRGKIFLSTINFVFAIMPVWDCEKGGIVQ